MIKTTKSFSIIELMVVIVILGLLASIVVPNLIGKSDDARIKLVEVQMRQLEEALKLFKLDIGRYPTTQEGFKILLEKPKLDVDSEFDNYSSGGYLSGSIPKDPWNNDYIYVNDDSEYDIISLGSDGKEGGKNEARDFYLSKIKKK